jgi:hypothetical protein
MTRPHPIFPSPMRNAPATIKATITGPNGRLWPYHATYTIGIGHSEGGDLAWTRKGIQRKARRTIRRLQRQQRTHNARRTITGRCSGCGTPPGFPHLPNCKEQTTGAHRTVIDSSPQTLTESWLINDYLNDRIDAHELDRRLNEILGI